MLSVRSTFNIFFLLYAKIHCCLATAAQDEVRRLWKLECKQNRRWLKSIKGKRAITWRASNLLGSWLKCKNPEEQAALLNPANTPNPSDDMKEAWRAWDRLKEERASAMARDPSATEVGDWWVAKYPEKLAESAEVKMDEAKEWHSGQEMEVEGDYQDEGGVEMDVVEAKDEGQGSYGGGGFVFNLPIRERP